jgi:hypothetical protein
MKHSKQLLSLENTGIEEYLHKIQYIYNKELPDGVMILQTAAYKKLNKGMVYLIGKIEASPFHSRSCILRQINY